MKERILDINPEVKVVTHKCFFLPENADEIPFREYDYVVDAIDTVAAKIAIVMKCDELNIPLISSMGTGNKLDPTRLQISDIYKTSVCPLARVMRHELKKRGIKKLKVLYSEENPITPLKEYSSAEEIKGSSRRSTPGSVSFVPSAGGLIIGSEVIRDIINS